MKNLIEGGSKLVGKRGQFSTGIFTEGTKLSYRIYEKGLRRLLDTFSFCEFPEQFEEYLRVQPEPPVNNTVLFVTKEVC